MSRQLIACLVSSLWGLLLFAGPSSSQVTPVGPFCSEGTGSGIASLGSVPTDQQFIITDFIWSPRVFETGPELSVVTSARLSEDDRTVWYWARSAKTQPGTYEVLPIEGHWGTVEGSGLVFAPGTSIGLEVEHVPTGINWVVCWTGYSIPLEPAAMNDVSAPSASTPLLQQNTPNPFNRTTEIRYTLASPGAASVRIYDVQGRLVRTFVEERKEASEHSILWDGRSDAGDLVASGVYYYELTTDGGREARKALMLR